MRLACWQRMHRIGKAAQGLAQAIGAASFGTPPAGTAGRLAGLAGLQGTGAESFLHLW